jgi:hypothetical protein
LGPAGDAQKWLPKVLKLFGHNLHFAISNQSLDKTPTNILFFLAVLLQINCDDNGSVEGMKAFTKFNF